MLSLYGGRSDLKVSASNPCSSAGQCPPFHTEVKMSIAELLWKPDKILGRGWGGGVRWLYLRGVAIFLMETADQRRSMGQHQIPSDRNWIEVQKVPLSSLHYHQSVRSETRGTFLTNPSLVAVKINGSKKLLPFHRIMNSVLALFKLLDGFEKNSGLKLINVSKTAGMGIGFLQSSEDETLGASGKRQVLETFITYDIDYRDQSILRLSKY